MSFLRSFFTKKTEKKVESGGYDDYSADESYGTSYSSSSGGKIIKADHKSQAGYDQELIDHSENIVDLVIVMDCTGSMSGEIDAAKKTVQTILSSLKDHFKTDLRFSAISYRDHSDDYAVREFPFTKDIQKAKSYIDTMSAQGGGDHPEALASALKVVNEMPFNKKGKKICIWIADAPPHGMNSNQGADSYPEGCKDENGKVIDWVRLGSDLQEKNVCFYSLICERAQGDQQLALFMDFLATKTDGKCMLLKNANKLPNLIINGSIENDEMDQLVAKKIAELGEETVKHMKEEELVEKIQQLSKDAKINQVQTFEICSTNTKELLNCDSLSKVNKAWLNTGTNNISMKGAESEECFEYASQCYTAPKLEHYSKACSRAMKSKR
ncbi:vWFA domain-containing protein [Naegleria gruberi]|uniref:VWFA domain-containing protein n=1 Tax=Naegleria gruberi TaxID=5762 RepID=D2V5N4_NAEGR|nr:vWFA domain-containing protein [Naegleria gruberi]EFC47680.1 vWFA domain-containing protein [Naegleria gruberi]|eukprot:XP_002680424.1 vWFA domain-containing protein [Naegleria gruberi strain NEG-M]